MSYIDLVNDHILNIECDCIVVEITEKKKASSALTRSIYKKANLPLVEDFLNQSDVIHTGELFISEGYELSSKYMIHVASPIWTNGFRNEPKLLYQCYYNSLKKAMEKNIHSIAFPLLSAGVGGYPIAGAIKKALQACGDFMQDNPSYSMVIHFPIQDEKIYKAFEILLSDSSLPTRPNALLDSYDVLLLETVDHELLHDCIKSCLSTHPRVKNYERIFLDHFDLEEVDRESYIHKLPSEYKAKDIYFELKDIYKNKKLDQALKDYYLLKLLLRIDDLLKTLE